MRGLTQPAYWVDQAGWESYRVEQSAVLVSHWHYRLPYEGRIWIDSENRI